ncbi:PDZ domain-containing protein [Cellulophaga baltica]|uniref:S41 family peptidase n=1 Tax=Cellulophaga TaxID=104264 RepID=UPI001C064C7C|nr:MULTISPECIES: S41 family peptidase [Cellulophaga]MBU2997139.1 PDZ domain-containing protein [Cellulophaga baltica]MDO6768537.1 S41 family peptidase [Cellulophaga sp. 1_MG-2023]
MKNLILFFFIFCFALHAQNEDYLVHNPTISHQGNQIAFSYQGDIWMANKDGSNLKRLTIHEAYEGNPYFTTDDANVVFQSNRFGNNDIFIVSIDGGIPKRLTYASSNDIITDVTPTSVIFNTRRDFVQVEADQEIFEIPLSGGTPSRLLNSLGFDATISPNGKLVAFTRGSCRIAREEYQGSANRDIWLYDIEKDSYQQLTTFKGNDFYPYWSGNNTIYFQSASTGKYNVHRAQLNNDNSLNKTEAITNFTDLGIFSYHIGDNGKTIILSQMDKLFLIDTKSNKTTQIKLNLSSDYKFYPEENKTYTSDVRNIVPSPNGKYSILNIRGELFLTENNKEQKRTINLSNSPYRDQNAFWLNDETIIFTSDRNGVQNLFKVTSSDPKQKDIFFSLKHSITQISNSKAKIDNPVLSPNRKSLAYTIGRGQLNVVNISETGNLSKKVTLNKNGWSLPSGLSWSPDNKWIAYSIQDLEFNAEIFIQKIDNSAPATNISMHPKADRNPIWSDDGTKIGFTSNRNNSDYDVWFVWLQKENWEKTPLDWKETTFDKFKKVDNSDSKSKKEESKEKEFIPISIDLDKIYERQVQVTRYSGGEFLQGISKDGETFYYTTGNGTRTNIDVSSDLYKIKWDGKDKEEITKGDTDPNSISLDNKKEYLYYTASGKPKRIKLAKSSDKPEPILFTAKMKINYSEESNQIFEEAWSAINNGFYDPNFHGHDWSLLKSQFKPLAIKASTRNDFTFIFNWMLGQINASHMGLRQGEKREDIQHERTGQLGIEVSPLENGNVKITAKTINMPADKTTSFLEIGSVITAVNGEKLTPTTNFYSLLNGMVDEKIYLSTKTPKGKVKEVVIRPSQTNRAENYLTWVNERKRLTDKYSNGELGYIHIQGMNWPSFERFERELTAAGYGKKGIVIDVRYNGGGWTTDYLMSILTVKQHAYTIPRGASTDLSKDHTNFSKTYPYSERLPLAAWTKPSIALINERSYSNAEIFAHAYKSLNIGTLVGLPTFGAVISTGSQRLIDGSTVRMPYRGWYVKNTGLDMDFQPATPDITVANTPDYKVKKQDKQLETAVKELLRQLNSK